MTADARSAFGHCGRVPLYIRLASDLKNVRALPPAHKTTITMSGKLTFPSGHNHRSGESCFDQRSPASMSRTIAMAGRSVLRRGSPSCSQ